MLLLELFFANFSNDVDKWTEVLCIFFINKMWQIGISGYPISIQVRVKHCVQIRKLGLDAVLNKFCINFLHQKMLVHYLPIFFYLFVNRKAIILYAYSQQLSNAIVCRLLSGSGKPALDPEREPALEGDPDPVLYLDPVTIVRI
jgi:hypothetical protein